MKINYSELELLIDKAPDTIKRLDLKEELMNQKDEYNSIKYFSMSVSILGSFAYIDELTKGTIKYSPYYMGLGISSLLLIIPLYKEYNSLKKRVIEYSKSKDGAAIKNVLAPDFNNLINFFWSSLYSI